MRVLIGHSYFLRFDRKLWQAMQPYAPLGTLCAAAMLRREGHEVHVFEAMLASSTGEWGEMVRQLRPDVAILFEDNFNYLSKMCLLRMREAAFEMLAAVPAGCPTVVAGADVTDHAADYIEHGATYAVIGEGEETITALLGALAAGDAFPESVEGLVFRDRQGRLQRTSARPVIRSLDDMPPPARDLIDIERYRSAWRRHGRFSMNLVTSRGCPFHCNWCAKPIWGQRYNVRSPESVVEEVALLKDLGAGHLWFMDDILGIKPGWLAAFATLLEERGLRVPFKCLSRADLLLRPGEIEALRLAGCETVWIGAESGSQTVLDAMEKGTSVEQIKAAAAGLKGAGIEVAFFLQFGYTGETWEDIEATRRLVRECDPDDIGMSVSYPLPGTPFYERVRESMTERANWVDSADMAMLYAGPYPTGFYHRLHTVLHTEFRLQKTGRRVDPASPAPRRARRALLTLKDRALLPLHRARLELARRSATPNPDRLPVVLSRSAAATPSPQEPGSDGGRHDSAR